MDIVIRRLTPELVEDYINFFDTTPHDDNTDESKCYCVCWCSADHRIETDFSSPEKRRNLAVQYVNGRIIQGYLAYYEGQVAGWCNTNTKADCIYCTSWLHVIQSLNTIEANPNTKVKSIFCFVIAPAMQRKGIATQLLERICIDAEAEGFDYIEAYPKKEFINVSRDFMGPVEMYKKFGFVLHDELQKNRIVMRKQLNL